VGNVGNIEKVMVFGILLIIIGILGIAIWGNNSIEEPRLYEPQGARVNEDQNDLNPPLKMNTAEASGLDAGSLIQDDEAPYLPAKGDVDDWNPTEPEELSYLPRPQVVDDQLEGRDGDSTSNPSIPGQYTVQKGDTFGSIAKKLFGSARHSVELQKANEDVDPRHMRIGQVLNVPSLEEGPGGDARDRSVGLGQAATGLEGKRTYEVKKGDTLFSIARAVLGGSSSRWREIYDANKDKLSSPNDLKPGMLLILPER